MYRRCDSPDGSDNSSLRRLNLVTPGKTPGQDGQMQRRKQVVAVQDE